MPLFEYSCPECGATLENLESFSAKPPICHSCGEAEMEIAAGRRAA